MMDSACMEHGRASPSLPLIVEVFRNTKCKFFSFLSESRAYTGSGKRSYILDKGDRNHIIFRNDDILSHPPGRDEVFWLV